MKRSNIILLSVAGFFALLLLWGVIKYNSLIGRDEKVKNGWANVQTSYQMRADLIPGLIAAVQEGAKNEKQILENVTKARAGLAEAKKEIAGAANPEQIENAGKKISSAFTLAVEAYPQIKGTDLFKDFQVSLSGVESRINTARNDYNDQVKEYNISIRTFPGNIIAGMGGFTPKEMFKSTEGAEKGIDVRGEFKKGEN
jgi:LemA protein